MKNLDTLKRNLSHWEYLNPIRNLTSARPEVRASGKISASPLPPPPRYKKKKPNQAIPHEKISIPENLTPFRKLQSSHAHENRN